MSAVILQHPFMANLQRQMRSVGLAEADTSNVTDLHAEKVRRNREASERKYQAMHDTSEPEPAA